MSLNFKYNTKACVLYPSCYMPVNAPKVLRIIIHKQVTSYHPRLAFPPHASNLLQVILCRPRRGLRQEKYSIIHTGQDDILKGL